MKNCNIELTDNSPNECQPPVEEPVSFAKACWLKGMIHPGMDIDLSFAYDAMGIDLNQLWEQRQKEKAA